MPSHVLNHIATYSELASITRLLFVIMANEFDFTSWSKRNALKEATVETLEKEDLDSEDALKLLTAKDVEDLGLTVGQKRLLAAALKTLQAQTGGVDVPEPVTTKSLAKDGGLDEILKKIEGAGSLEDSLLALGSTEPFINPPASKPSAIQRLDNDPHVFLGP